MNLISWNCRGLGNPRTVQEVASLVKRYNPLILFLSETKRKSGEMEWLRSRWGFENCLTVDSVGRSGGLALLWRQEVSLEILSYSNHHIDAKIGNTNNGEDWRFTGFYGDPITRLRCRSWELMLQFYRSCTLPWPCAGDFNEVMSENEKLGGAKRTSKQMKDFRRMSMK